MEKTTIRGIGLALLIGALMLPWFMLSESTTIEDSTHKANEKTKLTVGPDRLVVSETTVSQVNDAVEIEEEGGSAPIRVDAEAASGLIGASYSRAIVFFAQIRFLLILSLGLIMADILFGDRIAGDSSALSIAATASIAIAVALFLVSGVDAIQEGAQGRELAQDTSCEEGNKDDLDRCENRIEFTGLIGFPSYEYDVDTLWGGTEDAPETKEIKAKAAASWRPASGFLLAVLACTAMVFTQLESDPEKAAERKRVKEEKKAAKDAEAAAAAAAAPPAMPGMPGMAAAAPMPGVAPAPGAAAPPLPDDAPPAPMAPSSGMGYPPIPPPS